MKTFSRFLTEAEGGTEFVAKILINGTTKENSSPTDPWFECHSDCQWLDAPNSRCNLFQKELKPGKEGSNHLLRSKECLSATDALI